MFTAGCIVTYPCPTALTVPKRFFASAESCHERLPPRSHHARCCPSGRSHRATGRGIPFLGRAFRVLRSVLADLSESATDGLCRALPSVCSPHSVFDRSGRDRCPVFRRKVAGRQDSRPLVCRQSNVAGLNLRTLTSPMASARTKPVGGNFTPATPFVKGHGISCPRCDS